MVSADDLGAWVQKTDELGGIGSPEVLKLWEGFSYEPTVEVDTTLDPDGSTYRAQMLALYGEISGRSLDQELNEQTDLDVDSLVDTPSPYDGWDAMARAIHYLRVAKVVRQARLPKGARVLDMGCGWGLTSEFLAQLGCEVVAVDINPQFVELVARRAERLGLPITAVRSDFDRFEADPGSFDAVLFYESLHHAVDVEGLIARVAGLLKPEGSLMLAGEPVQDEFWPAWGLRLDPESVYCIHKFGWFESGWSRDYLTRVLARHDLLPSFVEDPDRNVGTTVVASRSWKWPALALTGAVEEDEWWFDGVQLVSNRAGKVSTLRLWAPEAAQKLAFRLLNPGEKPLPLRVAVRDQVRSFTLKPGYNRVVLDCSAWSGPITVSFRAPARKVAERGATQQRAVGFQLARAAFLPARAEPT